MILIFKGKVNTGKYSESQNRTTFAGKLVTTIVKF